MYNISKRNGARLIPIGVLVIIVAVSTTQLASMLMPNSNIADNAYAKGYSTNNDQASSQVINCSGNDENCVNNNPQAQGKDNDVNTPINSQITESSESPTPSKQRLEVRVQHNAGPSIGPGESIEITATCNPDEVVTGGISGWVANNSPDQLADPISGAITVPGQNSVTFFLANAPAEATNQVLTPAVGAYCAKLVDTNTSPPPILLPTP